MAIKKSKNVSTLPEPIKKGQEQIIVNQISITSADRTPKDLGDWRNAHINADSVYFPNRSRLYDIYKDVELDGYLSGLVSKRIETVLNKSWSFQGKDGKKVDALDPLMDSDAFRNVCKKMLESIFWGISGLEFIPGKTIEFKEIPRKHIKPKQGVISYNQNQDEGISYIGLTNLLIVGNATDLGLYLKCTPYALLKRGNLGDWGQFIEIFGQPIRVVKYDAYDTQAKVELKEVLDESGSSLALMIPKTADFEIMDGKSSNANGELQDKFKDALNDEMAVCILGNTETTGNNKGGTNAKSNTQRKEQLEITKSDIKFLSGLLNSEQFLSILKSYGYPVEGGKFVPERELDLAEVKSQMEIIKSAKDVGVPIEDDYIYEITGIPKPTNYDALKKGLTDAYDEADKRRIDIFRNPKKGNDVQEPEDNTELGFWNKLRSTIADFFDTPR